MTQALLNKKTGIPLHYANRHGLITGQTGTGKTVTLQRLAEQFSNAGVPVFISDVKGDIAALKRSCPVTFYDVFGQSGTPLKSTIAAMGADLLARSLELTDTQSGTLEIAFRYAQDYRLQLDTIDDLRALLSHMSENREHVSRRYGQVSNASIGVIMRSLLRLESQGGNLFFGNPQFDVARLMDHELELNGDAFGKVSILQAERLIQSPRVYGAFLLWMLSDLYERLPEIGDMTKPRLVMFFDEAHLLFNDINPALLRRIELIVRLIRSKGVGVYFVTQAPDDVPATIREQLAFQIMHSRQYKIGQALFTGIDHNGKPINHGITQIDLPACPLGALSDDEKPQAMPAVEGETVKPAKWEKLGTAEIVLLVAIIAAIAAAGYGLYWAWGYSAMGKAVVIALAIVFVGICKGK